MYRISATELNDMIHLNRKKSYLVFCLFYFVFSPLVVLDVSWCNCTSSRSFKSSLWSALIFHKFPYSFLSMHSLPVYVYISIENLNASKITCLLHQRIHTRLMHPIKFGLDCRKFLWKGLIKTTRYSNN